MTLLYPVYPRLDNFIVFPFHDNIFIYHKVQVNCTQSFK
jgi:hypothetical protein